jgi:hypothetical protein
MFVDCVEGLFLGGGLEQVGGGGGLVEVVQPVVVAQAGYGLVVGLPGGFDLAAEPAGHLQQGVDVQALNLDRTQSVRTLHSGQSLADPLPRPDLISQPHFIAIFHLHLIV